LLDSLKYYLETNALYLISKIPKEILVKSYTSALAIHELISGINPDNFDKRKNLLILIKANKLVIDWRMPEEIIADSFDALFDHDFIDNRTKSLSSIYHLVCNLKNFEEFEVKVTEINLSLNYFKDLDKYWSSNFINSIQNGNKEIKKIFESEIKQVIPLDDKEFTINSHDDLEIFFAENPLFNKSITIYALASLLFSMIRDEDINENNAENVIANIYQSYNSFIEYYVNAASLYNQHKILNKESAAKNDFVDLFHLLYLRNFSSTKIISDDNIYYNLLNIQNTIKLKDIVTK
jgi:hypothetical protein